MWQSEVALWLLVNMLILLLCDVFVLVTVDSIVMIKGHYKIVYSLN